MKTVRYFFTAAFAYVKMNLLIASRHRVLIAMLGVMFLSLEAQAAEVQHLNTQTASASGAGASGTPSIASFNIPAGKNRVLFIWAGFERDHISPADVTAGYGVSGNTAGTGLGDNYPETRIGTPPATTSNNQITARVVGASGTVDKKNALVIGGTPSGDTRFINISTSPSGSPSGTAFFSVGSFHIVLFENEIKTLLGSAASGTVAITLPDVVNPSNAGDDAFIVASVFQNVEQAVTAVVRNGTATAQVTTGTPGNASLAPAAYDAGQAPDEAADGKLVLGANSSTEGFVTPTGHVGLATVSITNANGQYDNSNGNINNEPNGLTAGAYFRNGGATPSSLYTLQMAGAAATLIYGGTNASFLLESDNADTSDAPTSYGEATHAISGIRLGDSVDADSSALNNSTATGDDVNGTDDENGVTIPASLYRGLTQTIPVSIQNASGRLNGWIDWNADGDFNDAGEQIANDQAVTAGTVNLSVSVPSGAVLGQSMARFRVSTNAGECNTPASATASGEVEDYAVTLAAPSGNATLSALSLSEGTLTPAFSSGTNSYTASVPNATSSVTVTATRAEANATLAVQVNGGGYSALTSGSPSSALALVIGSNTVDVRVTAQDGTTTTTYTTTITRRSSVATLSSLTTSTGAFTPTFASDTTSYAMLVPNTTTALTVTPTVTQTSATVTVNTASVSSGSPSGLISLNVGSNITTVTVTAEDTSFTTTYTLTVTRAAPSPTLSSVSPATGSTAGGTGVTITGTNFTGATAVTIGGTAATIGTITATSITATTGAHAAGVVNVAVTTPGGTGTGLNLYTYVTPVPEIAVFDGIAPPAGERTDNVGTFDFGSVNTGSSSAAQTFTIQNLGSATADLTGLAVTSTNATEFTFTAPLAATLAPGATTTFTVTFSPSGTGARSGVIKIASNDTDENPFDIMLTGTGLVPEIGIANSLAVDIPDTGSQAFGTTEVGLDLFQTFTVSNSGTGALSIGAITFDGANPSDFIVSTAPALSSVPGPGSTTFTVRFRPLGTGARSAVMSIVNDDADENPFDITVTGTGLAPEIVVHDGSHSLAPELSDGQVMVVSFGSTAQNVASVRSFLVRNTGDAPLDITTITVPAGYNTNGAAVTMAPGTSYSFQVSMESATPATYAGNVVINSDDLSEAAFDFPVTGSVVAPGSSPVVNVGGDIAVQGTTGSAVLGGPVGSTLYSFIGSPALNSSGVLASAVQIRHSDASLHTGVMSGQPLVLIATDTQTAPSLPGVTYFSFSPPVINETDHIAFTAEVRGAGITKNVNSRCLFSNASDGVIKLVAQVGASVGLGSNLKTLGNFSIGGDLVIFLGTLVDNSIVLFGWDASTGLRPLVRKGQSLSANGATKTVQSFSILETSNASSGHGKELSVAPTGESLVTFGVTFTDGTSGVVVGSFDGTSDTGFGATYGASQQLADTYAAPAVIPLAKWGSFRSPGFDNTGSYYGFISQMLTNTLAGVSTTNNVGVFVDTTPGVLTLQLRENDAAPGTSGLVFSDFSDLVLGGGDYEFLVKGEVRGTGVVTNVNNVGLWSQHATNGLELVAREGSEAPGVSGSNFLRLSQAALPGTAQPMFQATMKTGVGGVTTANDTGLWVVNESGVVKLAVREGDVINVGGTDRTVTAITALLNGTTTGGALGRRAFLADGQLTLLLTFSGGIQANAKVVVP
jgi:hypothetical protein